MAARRRCTLHAHSFSHTTTHQLSPYPSRILYHQSLPTMQTNRVGLDLFKTLLTPDARSIHLLAFGAAFGSQIWTSFVAGPIALSTLPRQQFGSLMEKTFPTYFAYNAVLTSVMVGTLAYDFSVIRKHPFDIFDATVYQAFTLAASAASHLVNALVVAPASAKIMNDRHRQEKAEGKSYTDAGVSLNGGQVRARVSDRSRMWRRPLKIRAHIH